MPPRPEPPSPGRWGWARDRRASVAVTVALAAVVLIGLVALGAEVTLLFVRQRQMQAAADAGAVAAAVAMATQPTSMLIEAQAVAGDSGFVAGSGGTTVSVNNPPTAGSHAGDASAVEVVITQPQRLGLARLFHPDAFSVAARAVALGGTGGMFCVFALDPSASAAVHLYNNAGVNNPRCGVAANSSSASALLLDNNAVIQGPVYLHGGSYLSNGAALTGSPVLTGAAVVADPYAGVSLQTPPACTAQSGSRSGTFTLQPGHFCNGWNIGNGSRVTLAAGTYIIDRQMALGNTVRVDGTAGVTLVFNGNFTLVLGNSTWLTLNAQSSGPYSGLVIYGPATNSAGLTQTFSNNVTMTILGAIYFPSQTVTLSNNAIVNATRCTQLIGRIVNLSNNVALDNDCGGTGVGPIGSSAQLVE